MAVTPTVPIRTPMFDEFGNISRAWVLFFEALGKEQVISSAGTGSVTEIEGLALTDVADIPASERANFGEGSPGGIVNPRYTIDHAGIETVGICLTVDPPADSNFAFANIYLDRGDDGEKLEYQGSFAPADGAPTGDVYYAILWIPRPETAETWALIGAAVGQDGAANTPDPSNTATKVVLAITAVEGVGYPTIGTLLEEGVLIDDVPHVRLTIPYTAPASGSFVGFTVFWRRPAGDWTDEAFNDHPGEADGQAGQVERWWRKPDVNETWDIVLSPHTRWDGHKLLIAPDNRNKGSVLVEAPGPPADSITDATVDSVTYLTEVDEYGHPTFKFAVSWTNPSNDANFYYSVLTVQLVDALGNGEPTTLLGDERDVYEASGPGQAVQRIEGPWGPVGLETYDRFRLRLFAVNRFGVRTLQTTAWGGNSAYDIVTDGQIGWPALDSILQQSAVLHDVPQAWLTFNWTAPPEKSFVAMSIWRRVDGGDWISEANIDAPNGADGGSYSFDLWFDKPESAAETWDFVLAPHTKWDGHRRWIAPGNINTGSIVVQPQAPPAADGITAASASAPVYLHELDAMGNQTFAADIVWTNPSDDTNFYHAVLTVQLLDLSGNQVPLPGGGGTNPLSFERVVHELSGPGESMSLHVGPWGPVAAPGYAGFRYRLRLYARNRKGEDTLQSTAWGGAAYYDIVTADQGATLKATRLDPDTLGYGLRKDAATGEMELETEDLSNMAWNANFTRSVWGWAPLNGGAIAHQATGGYGTAGVLRIDPGPNSWEGASNERRVPIRPGDRFYSELYCKAGGAADGTIKLQINYLDQSGAASGAAVSSTISPTTDWTKISLAFTVPAGKAYLHILAITDNFSTGAWYLDSVRLQRMVQATAEVADGLLSEMAKFGVDVRPIKIVSSLPVIPNDEYPVGQAIVNTADGKLYRNKSNVWTKAVDELDVTKVYAAAVIAGLFDGHSLRLDLNGALTEVRNLYDGIIGEYAGIKVSNAYGRTVMTPGSVMSANAAEDQYSFLFRNVVQAQYGSKYARLQGNSWGGALVIDGSQVMGPRITGWGTSTGTHMRGPVVAESITLFELAAKVAQLIFDLKTHGVLGT